LESELSDGLDIRLGWRFDDDSTAGLHIRNSVAVPTDGRDAEATLVIKVSDWARMLGGKTTLNELLEQQEAEIEGEEVAFVEAIRCFDNPSLR
jgi:alkyl sulfatase BDS1-like metallo-beta-lactamase superfamily hydrolase